MTRNPNRKNGEPTDPLPERMALRLKSRSPVLYRATQLVFWLASVIASKPLTSGLFVASLLGLIGAPLVVASLWSARHVFWITAGVLALGGLVVLILLVINKALRRLFVEIDARDDAVRRAIRDALVPLKVQLSRIEDTLNELQQGTHETDKREVERIREELATVRKELKRLASKYNR